MTLALFRRLAAASLSAALLCAPALAADAKPMTLAQAYAAALKRSEAVAQKRLSFEQVTAQVDELWAAVRPKLNLNANQFWQDTPGSGVGFPLPSSQQTVAVNAHQPLFSGLREYLAVRAAKSNSESAELALARARQLLYQDVANAYLSLLVSRRAIATREAQVKLTEDRVKELKGFEEIGRSRRSEVLAAQSQLAQNQADLEAARGQERLRQATLQFLTGLDEDLAPEDVALPAAADDPAPFYARARRRADVEAARRDYESADLLVSMQKRQYWPTISADGNYYLLRPRTYTQHVRWDAAISGQLPLYSGGAFGAQVREAQAQRGVREQALSLAERDAQLDVKSAHSDLASSLSVVKALENAMALAEANAKAQREDYRHGLVTNIDVLASLATVQDTHLRLDSARAQAVLARARLEVAAGGPEEQP